MSNLPDDDLVTRLLNSDGRVDELLKEAAGYIITLRHSLVVLNNQLSKESQRGQCVIWPHQERLLQQRTPRCLVTPPYHAGAFLGQITPASTFRLWTGYVCL